MGCCESNDDVEMLDTHNDNAVDKKQSGGCCGTSGCGIKMWIVMAIVVAVILYITQS